MSSKDELRDTLTPDIWDLVHSRAKDADKTVDVSKLKPKSGKEKRPLKKRSSVLRFNVDGPLTSPMLDLRRLGSIESEAEKQPKQVRVPPTRQATFTPVEIPSENFEEKEQPPIPTIVRNQSYFKDRASDDYSKEYLDNNPIKVLYEAFKNLDSTLNLFFFTYSGLQRSSFMCAKIWLTVMKLRMIMNDSISHLLETPRFLAPSFLESTNLHIIVVREASKAVAKAVQFLVTFQNHSEQWLFHRKRFLQELVEEITTNNDKVKDQWVEFECTKYDMSEKMRNGYRNHIEIETLRIINSIVKVQPKSEIAKNDEKYSTCLKQMIKDLQELEQEVPNGNILAAYPNIDFDEKTGSIIDNNFYNLRIQLSIVKDIKNMAGFKESLPNSSDETEDILKDYNEGREFLLKQLQLNQMEQILAEDDETLWPHQKGIKQVGPYEVLPIFKPARFIQLAEDESCYSILPNIVEATDMFTHESIHPGRMSKAYKTRIMDIEQRASLKIPQEATSYRYLHPIEVNYDDLSQEVGEAVVKKWDAEVKEMFSVFSPLHALAKHGGFAYFDKEDKLLQVNGFMVGEDIFFDGPYFLPSPEGFDSNDSELILTDVTFRHLTESKARKHGWVGTREELSPFKKKNEEIIDHDLPFIGGFVFKYDNSNHPEWDNPDNPVGGRRNYFQLMSFKELKLKKLQHRNTPLLKKLKYEIDIRNKAWDILHETEEHELKTSDICSMLTKQVQRFLFSAGYNAVE